MKTKIFILSTLFFFLTIVFGFAQAEETLPYEVKLMLRKGLVKEVEKEAEKMAAAGKDYMANLTFGELALLKGDVRVAAIHFRKVMDLNPAGIEGKIGMAKVYAAEGDIKKAMLLLEEAKKVSPYKVRLYYEMGRLYEVYKEEKKAAWAYEQALERFFRGR